MVTKRTATLHCVATLFIPEPITFLWKAPGLEIPRSSQSLVPTANEDGSYSARSELTLAREDWEAGTSYTCQLANAQSDPISTTLRVEDGESGAMWWGVGQSGVRVLEGVVMVSMKAIGWGSIGGIRLGSALESGGDYSIRI
ncbi:hypothetical protein chiPu_0022731 [Chiloscyllium punctatum]|uniref:Ig-like domain-containing protein n=1 Tax=Chiloscyllium punctatum TaxID=137246 RepID=A0A401T920_CHIPU|nr:hypothetical protein [Chiloscyllium punctatum]